MFCAPLLKALPHLSLGRSLMGVLGNYFTQEKLRICFTFQAKYIGMSPWECPAAFAIMPYIEHSMGIDHVVGGLSKISEAMAKIIVELGGEIHLNSPVKKICVSGKNATGVELFSGTIYESARISANLIDKYEI